MRYSFIVAAAALILAGIALALRYGDEVLRDRFAVGSYTHVPIASATSTNLPVVVREGLAQALQSCRLSTNEWFLAPQSESAWTATNALALVNEKPSSLVLVVTNQVTGGRLYVRIEPTATNGFEFKLYRSK